ncbi:MAG: GNAT family N-acetyltransferase [Clostridia bacterium]|nr:GNAT family N-acetyltransferase [Clostridia bacterium]MDR3643991.1 GNAT family N-acetyltransferase [Clostridia bacterium]
MAIGLYTKFYALPRKTYGFDFEQWYEDGYWQERFVPYSLLDADTVVSNVSVNILDFLVLGQRKRYIQLGTVMTDRAYRGQGLNRALMEKVLSDWQGRCDLIYLFANDSVLDYYPKFGFTRAEEYQCTGFVTAKAQHCACRKLDMSDENDKSLLYRAASQTKCFSKISMLDNVPLIMFYATSFKKDNVYYIDKYDAAAIAQYEGDTLFLQDVFCPVQIPVDRIIEALLNKQTCRVVLGFTPLNDSPFEFSP